MPVTASPRPGFLSGRGVKKPKVAKRKLYPAPKGYVGGWKLDPGLAKKRFKTVKTGKGYYIAKPLKPKGRVSVKGPGAAAPKGPTTPPGPYDMYATSYPAGKSMLEDLDRREASQTAYVTGQVMPWLSGGLRALTGVDPAAPGYNPLIQQQYQANIQGQVGGALNAAAAAVPGSFAPTTPGASTAAPNAYLGRAMQEASAQRAGAAINMAQAQSALSTVAPNIYAQSAMRSIADYAAGLPAIYVEKRNELRAKIDQFVEDTRHRKVMEATAAMTAQGNLAISLGNLGVRTTSEANDKAAQDAKLAQDAADAKAKGVKPPPVTGYVVVPDGSGGWEYKTDPTYVKPSSGGSGGGDGGGTSTRDAQGRLRVPSLQEKGYRRSGVKGSAPQPKVPSGWKVTKGADGNWWVLRPKAAGGSSKPTTTTGLQKDLRGLYKPGGTGGWEEAHPDDPRGAAVEVARWVRENKPAFAGAGRRVNLDRLRDVVGGVIGINSSVTKEVRRILQGYMVQRSGVWYWK